MGFTLLNYNLSAAAAGAANSDMVAASDPDFSQRNSHYIFTEPYMLLGAALIGASVTRGRFQVPTWNAIGEFTLFNANRAITPPTNPMMDWWKAYPPALPINEEFQVQVSNNLGMGTEVENCPLLLATSDWNANLPSGRLAVLTRASFTVTPILNGWSGGQQITLAQSLRGGVYSVVGAQLQGANAAAFRIIFPRYRLYHGRKLRPGWLTQTALGDVTNLQAQPWSMSLGEWGRFHTFELPQVEVFGTVAGAITYQLFLWLIYLGEDLSLLNQGLGGGM